MSLIKREFLLGLKELRYPGNAEQLWGNFDRDGTGNISFMEFVPEDALDLARFKAWVLQKFGGFQELFRVFDNDKNGKLSFDEFEQACHREGLPDRLKDSVETLFALVADPKRKRGMDVITMDDLVFLEKWKPPAYLWEPPDEVGAAKFKDALSRRYNQNPWLAWRKALDKDGSMRVGFSEFSEVCRELAKAGLREAAPKSVSAVYVGFDKDRSGWFTLEDWDATAYNHLLAFVTWARQRFRKVSELFRSMEDISGEGLSLGAFRRGIKEGPHKLELDSESIEDLFEGLTREPIQYIDGRMRAGRIIQAQFTYLDQWNPDKEAEENQAWEQMASKRMSLKRGYSIDMQKHLLNQGLFHYEKAEKHPEDT